MDNQTTKNKTETMIEVDPRIKRIIKFSPGLFGCLIALVLIAAIFIPYLPIWAVNTLFGTSIAYSFPNWCASAILLALFGNVKASVSR
jgi:hypothetical protein